MKTTQKKIIYVHIAVHTPILISDDLSAVIEKQGYDR